MLSAFVRALPRTLLRGVGAAGARMRGARLMHPKGRAYAATVVTTGAGGRTGAVLLDRRRRYRATVRLSKATATPRGWPDVFGLAVRLRYGRVLGLIPRRPVDLLLSTSSPRRLLRHQFLPRRGPAAFYSSLAAYRTGRGRRVFLGAVLDRDPRTGTPRRGTPRRGTLRRGTLRRGTLLVASRFGPWRPFATLVLRRPLSQRISERLAFDPIGNVPRDLVPVGLVQRLRAPVYRGSQQGRSGPLQRLVGRSFSGWWIGR